MTFLVLMSVLFFQDKAVSPPLPAPSAQLVNAGLGGDRSSFTALLAAVQNKVREAVSRIPQGGQPAIANAVLAVQKRSQLFNGSDPDGVTPLMFAAKQGWDDLVHLLIEGHANASAVDNMGRKASYYADESGYGDLAAYLRSHGQ